MTESANVVPLIFLDTETTHLRPDVGTPWDIAWITATHHPVARRLVVDRVFEARVLLTAREVVQADAAALGIGRYVERSTMDLWDRQEIINQLREDANRATWGTDYDKPFLVGAVPSFDHAMLCQNWLGWPGFGEGLWHYRLACWETLAAGRLGIPPGWSTTEMLYQLGVTPDPATKHTAIGDVRTALAVYAAIYDLEVEQ